MTWTRNQFRAFNACLGLTAALLLAAMLLPWADPLLAIPLWVVLLIAWGRL